MDGKPGHDNQSRGLVQALADLTPLVLHTLPAVPIRCLLSTALGRQPAEWRALSCPDLIVGAGHRTHWSLLAARRARGGRCVVLMKPTLPPRWFDLCMVPEHDRVAAGPRVLPTQGVLNAIRPGGEHRPDRGLALIGGPSSHYEWSDDLLLAQLQTILEERRRWTLGTSRRTPAATVERLQALTGPGVTLVPWQQTTPDWLPAQLAQAGLVWVSEDSVSMVFEALSSGAAVAILELPPSRESRVSRGVAHLVSTGYAVSYSRWLAGTAPRPPAPPFNEATRCARWILEHWWRDA